MVFGRTSSVSTVARNGKICKNVDFPRLVWWFMVEQVLSRRWPETGQSVKMWIFYWTGSSAQVLTFHCFWMVFGRESFWGPSSDQEGRQQPTWAARDGEFSKYVDFRLVFWWSVVEQVLSRRWPETWKSAKMMICPWLFDCFWSKNFCRDGGRKR